MWLSVNALRQVTGILLLWSCSVNLLFTILRIQLAASFLEPENEHWRWYNLFKTTRHLNCFLVGRMFRITPFNIVILSYRSLFKFVLIWSEDLVSAQALWAWQLPLARSCHADQGWCGGFVYDCKCCLHTITLVCLV